MRIYTVMNSYKSLGMSKKINCEILEDLIKYIELNELHEVELKNGMEE